MNRNNRRTFVWATGLLAFGFLALGLLMNPGEWSEVAAQGGSPWGADATRRNEGPIMFEFTPKGVEDGHFRVDVRVDTHSGDLAEIDLKRQLRLTADGKTHSPTSEVRLGGHHSAGKLFFALQRAPERFEIVVGKVGTMGDLTFRWP